MNSKRIYREDYKEARLTSFSVKVKETDLWIAVDKNAWTDELPGKVEQFVWRLRKQLEEYLGANPRLASSLKPLLLTDNAPEIARVMSTQANRAGVGMMAAVAGAFAEAVGRFLLECSKEVVVENGGDIYIKAEHPLKVGIYAGNSPLSGKLALQVAPEITPLGVCTSSGTVGPSQSFGKADAAVAVSPSVPLADAVATALGNMIKTEEDLEKALAYASHLEGINGALLIYGEKVAAWGGIHLVKKNSQKE